MISEFTQLSGVLVGEVIGVDANGQPLVAWSGVTAIAARAVWTPGAPPWGDCIGARVLLTLVNGDETQPVVLGLLEPRAVSNNDRRADHIPETLRVEAGRELVIECGEAKISLRKDGRIEIRGTHLISRSSGPNKIKGGSVFIN